MDFEVHKGMSKSHKSTKWNVFLQVYLDSGPSSIVANCSLPSLPTLPVSLWQKWWQWGCSNSLKWNDCWEWGWCCWVLFLLIVVNWFGHELAQSWPHRDDVHHYEGDIICCRMVMILMLKMLTTYQGDQGTNAMWCQRLWCGMMMLLMDMTKITMYITCSQSIQNKVIKKLAAGRGWISEYLCW